MKNDINENKALSQTSVSGCFYVQNVKVYKIIKIFCFFCLVVTKYVIYLYSDNNKEVIITKK